MKKHDAIKLFGNTETEMAKAIGVTKQYINKWPDELTQKQEDWVRGAAVRLGISSTPAHNDQAA